MAGNGNDRDDENGVEQWDHDEPLETEQLALEGEDDRLPWLESDDDYEEEYSDDSRRMFAFVLLGLVALAAIVGGIWWATNRNPDAALVADGSTIAAPEGPYKEAPKDPGGKKMDGTGDSTFAVSAGQSRGAQLGGQAEPPKPSVDLGRPGAATAATPAGGTGVQVGAYSTREAAEAAWGRMAQQYSALSGVPHRVQQGEADIGTVWRLQAVAANPEAASQLCGRLRTAGLACQVK